MAVVKGISVETPKKLIPNPSYKLSREGDRGRGGEGLQFWQNSTGVMIKLA
jgi:hypothetical protein